MQLSGLKNPDITFRGVYKTPRTSAIICSFKGHIREDWINLNTFVSSNQPTNIPRVMYGEREVQFLRDKKNYQLDFASGNWGTAATTVEEVLTGTPTGADFTEMDVYNSKTYTDWLDIILQNGVTQNYEASASGGNEKTNFSLSFGTMFEQGLMKNDELDRYNGKLTIDHKVNKMLKVGTPDQTDMLSKALNFAHVRRVL